MSRLAIPGRSCRWMGLSCLLLLVVGSGCHRKRTPVLLPTEPASASTALSEEEQIGVASWYGDPYHGRRTTNGEIYNKFDLTAAHRTLPFDTVVRVNNLDNGKAVKVRINDRGPFVKNRIIDLSYAAAREINMIGPGSAKVRLDVVTVLANPYPLTIQVGSFKEKDNAEQLKRTLEAWYSPVMVWRYETPDGVLYRVYAGKFSTQDLATSALHDLKRRGYDGLMVRLDR